MIFTVFGVCIVHIDAEETNKSLGDTFIKVGLIYDKNMQDNIQISSDDNLKIVGQENFVTTRINTFIKDNKIYIIDTNNQQNVLCFDNEIDIFVSPNSVVYVNGSPYRGYIRLKKDNQAKLTVINIVRLEEYLYSVITSEVPCSYPEECLKTQAVCARNYAIQSLNKHQNLGFDICASDHCQCYRGKNIEHSKGIKAVNDTKGMTLKYQGKLARIFFTASNGGQTEDVKYVWGNSIPYLISVPDIYESENEDGHNWKFRITVKEINNLLHNLNIGQIEEIVILEKSPAGSVTKLKVNGSNGCKIFVLESTRTFLGGGRLKSQCYNIEKVKFVTPFVTISTDGEILEQVEEEEWYVFDGKGWGHRVGMSQCGAKGMAMSGKNFYEILSHYFPGTYICTT